MKSLRMKFQTQFGKKVYMSISDVKKDLDAEGAKALMDVLIEKKAFKTSGGDLTGKLGAEVVETTSTELF